MLQDEADEDVVEASGRERRSEDVRLLEAALERPAASTAALARARELSEMSTDRICAPGLRRASGTVCAPTPHPASRTVLPSE